MLDLIADIVLPRSGLVQRPHIRSCRRRILGGLRAKTAACFSYAPRAECRRRASCGDRASASRGGVWFLEVTPGLFVTLKEDRMRDKRFFGWHVPVVALLGVVLFCVASVVGVSASDPVFKIAFVSDRSSGDGRGNLWVVDSDGSGLTQLTDFDSRWSVADPIFSHDGQWIVFTKEDRAVSFRKETWKIRVDGTESVLLNDPGPQPFGNSRPLKWSPDDQVILLTSEQSNHNGWFELWKVQTDGAARFNCSPGEGTGVSAAFSPDGSKIVYGIPANYYLPSRLTVMDSDCSNKRVILDASYWPGSFGPISSIVWTSADDIIFVIGEYWTARYNVYKIRPDGSGLVPLVATPEHESFGGFWWGNGEEECVTRDGRELVVYSNATGSYEVYLVRVDGSSTIQLTSDKADDKNPAFSPDGNEIVWISNMSGPHALWIMDKDGTNKRQITDAIGEVMDLTVSPIPEPVDTTPPVISSLPPDMVLQATVPSGAIATWAPPSAIDDVDGVVPVTCVPNSGSMFPINYPPGSITLVTCSATDKAGNMASASFTVAVVDTIAPTLVATANPSELWPPNGKMRSVTISGVASDSGSGVAGTTGLFKVTDEYGLVQPQGTFTVSPSGGFSFSVALEASRNGTDMDGRHYTVAVTVTDLIGNATTTSVDVIVPHDQRK